VVLKGSEIFPSFSSAASRLEPPALQNFVARIERALQAGLKITFHSGRHFAACDSARAPVNRQCDLSISSLHVGFDSVLSHG
jgi:hypothetical protein